MKMNIGVELKKSRLNRVYERVMYGDFGCPEDCYSGLAGKALLVLDFFERKVRDSFSLRNFRKLHGR